MPTSLDSIVDENTTLFWFRRDLRLADNNGLHAALTKEGNVVCVFIFDSNILDKLEDRIDLRVQFIFHQVAALKGQLEKKGTSLLVLKGDPLRIFTGLRARTVYANHDYEPYARKRDEMVNEMLSRRNGGLVTFKDQVIFEKGDVVKNDGTPYTVFTPYARKWRAALNSGDLKGSGRVNYSRFKRVPPLPLPDYRETGFEWKPFDFPSASISTPLISAYDRQRDFPAITGTSRMGIHLRFGTVSIRTVVSLALEQNDTWLGELIWREFYQMILWHFPRVADHSFKKEFDKIPWRNDAEEFDRWCNGKTGYPIVDAGMRELVETGFMHNRVRMIVASFLTKHLLIDWRWGEAWFAKHLLDYELASNNGGWQWAAGSGCDAVPYFRVFNPQLQTQKFDFDLHYIRKWVPELDTPGYPAPMVEHKFARDRAITTFQKALRQR